MTKIIKTNKPIWFCYEKGSATTWQPCCYHLWKPSSNADTGAGVIRSSVHEVPANCLDDVGEPVFSKLLLKFPAPIMEYA